MPNQPPQAIKIGENRHHGAQAQRRKIPWGSRNIVDAINKDGGVYVKEFNKKIPIELVEAITQAERIKCLQGSM
jgi:hypothetical protein